MGKIKLGIIGIGNMGSNYATKVTNGECPDFELVAVRNVRQRYAGCLHGRNTAL